MAPALGAGGVFRGEIAKSRPAFLFVWTLHALGVTAMFSLILSVCGLWSLHRASPLNRDESQNHMASGVRIPTLSQKARKDGPPAP